MLNIYQSRWEQAAVARSPRKEDTRATLARGDGLKQAVLNTKAVFDIDTMGADNPPVVVISDPYSVSVSPILTETRPGLYRVEYRPTKLGTHSIEITVGGRAISYSPFKCEVLDPQSVRVTDIGPIEIETEHQHQQAMEEKPCWSRKSGVDIKQYVIREEQCYTCSLCLKNFKECIVEKHYIIQNPKHLLPLSNLIKMIIVLIAKVYA